MTPTRGLRDSINLIKVETGLVPKFIRTGETFRGETIHIGARYGKPRAAAFGITPFLNYERVERGTSSIVADRA